MCFLNLLSKVWLFDMLVGRVIFDKLVGVKFIVFSVGVVCVSVCGGLVSVLKYGFVGYVCKLNGVSVVNYVFL